MLSLRLLLQLREGRQQSERVENNNKKGKGERGRYESGNCSRIEAFLNGQSERKLKKIKIASKGHRGNSAQSGKRRG